jgi:hypothetical protein
MSSRQWCHFLWRGLCFCVMQCKCRWSCFGSEDSGGAIRGWETNHIRPDFAGYTNCWWLGVLSSPCLLAFTDAGSFYSSLESIIEQLVIIARGMHVIYTSASRGWNNSSLVQNGLYGSPFPNFSYEHLRCMTDLIMRELFRVCGLMAFLDQWSDYCWVDMKDADIFEMWIWGDSPQLCYVCRMSWWWQLASLCWQLM